MIEWTELTSNEIAELDKSLPVIVPLGLVEAHGPHLAVSVDNDTANYFAREVACRTGAILVPALPYGFSDEMREYPGSLGVSADTFSAIIVDLCKNFCFQGFQKVIFLTGHGANKAPCELAFYKVWEQYPDFKGVCWNWWSDCGITGVHHANEKETEVALAVGTASHMDRVENFSVDKPWHKIRSRYALSTESGGINGNPSKADIRKGHELKDQALEVLTQKMLQAINDK
jgi:creatinine amidohydrolase